MIVKIFAGISEWYMYTIFLLYIPYSQKIWRGIKFGSLEVYSSDRQIKIRQNFLLTYMHMAIPYQIIKFKSANTFAMVIWDPTAKFNSRQYFWLYGRRKITYRYATCKFCE